MFFVCCCLRESSKRSNLVRPSIIFRDTSCNSASNGIGFIAFGRQDVEDLQRALFT